MTFEKFIAHLKNALAKHSLSQAVEKVDFSPRSTVSGFVQLKIETSGQAIAALKEFIEKEKSKVPGLETDEHVVTVTADMTRKKFYLARVRRETIKAGQRLTKRDRVFKTAPKGIKPL